jgi:uncharacterized membrane protein YgcG
MMNGDLRRAIVAIGVVLLIAGLGAVPTTAQTTGRSVTWQNYDVDLAIQPDGSIVVTETQTIAFTGTYQQGYRLVPLDRTTGVTDVRVAEVVNGQPVQYSQGSGQPGTYSARVGNDGLQVDWWFPPTSNSMRTFVLRYTANGAVRMYDGGDQLQWRAIYADRAGLIGAGVVTAHLPADVAATSVQSAWYRYSSQGPLGALPVAAQGTLVDARTVRFQVGQLPANQGAEVRVQFPHGLVAATPPAWQGGADRADWLAQSAAPIGNFLAVLLALVILAGGGAFLLFVWMSNGRDPAIGTVPVELQEPPSDLPAPLAGTLVDEVASEREVVAALVDLGDRGLVGMADEQNPALAGSQSDVRIKLETAVDDERLRGYERVLLTALFGPRPKVPAEILLSGAKQQFTSRIPQIDARLYEGVTSEGLFVRNPETIRRVWWAVGSVVILGGVALAVGVMVALAGAVPLGWLPGVALVVLGTAVVLVANAMPRRTARGALEAARWRAFRTHLKRVSQSDTPEAALHARYLAYAVAFGVDQSFVHHMESVGIPPPRWYGQSSRGPGGVVILPGGWYGGPWMGPHGDGTGTRGVPSAAGGVVTPEAPNPQGWSDALAALLNAASDAMAHGGGSGGWSGGGFGGGGGGGGGSGGFR